VESIKAPSAQISSNRLNVFPIKMPALRDRPGDIPLLVQYLVERYAQKAGKRFRRVSKETLDLFEGYAWPWQCYASCRT